MTDIGHSAQ